MRKIEFYKLEASGNDFILIDRRQKAEGRALNYKRIAKKYCQRKLEIGADGLLVIERSKEADFKMRIFNPDGSEAEMCGNGARCVGLWASIVKSKIPASPAGRKNQKFRQRRDLPKAAKIIKFETKAGIIEAQTTGHKARSPVDVRIKTSDPFALKLNLPLKISHRKIKVNYINSGVPHTVIFVQGLESIDVETVGRQIRFHKKFSPQGTNVNFVEILKEDFIKLRTYERGVEEETLACGTGVIASAIITSCKLQDAGFRLQDTNCRLPAAGYKLQASGCRIQAIRCRVQAVSSRLPDAGRRQRVEVLTKGGETLKVYFVRKDSKISNVWLQGGVHFVFKGEIV